MLFDFDVMESRKKRKDTQGDESKFVMIVEIIPEMDFRGWKICTFITN